MRTLCSHARTAVTRGASCDGGGKVLPRARVAPRSDVGRFAADKVRRGTWKLGGQPHASVRRLDPKRDRPKLAREIGRYKTDANQAFRDAAKDFTDRVQPVADGINKDIDDQQQAGKLPKDAVIKQRGLLPNWALDGKLYLAQVDAALKTGDLSSIDPDNAFPADGFPTDVQ
jgi:hypothetical protein